MKRNHKAAIIILFAASSVILNSCSYGFQQGLWRKNPVEQRSSSLEIVPPPVDNPEELLTKEQYSVLVLSDVHFGKDKNRCEDKLDHYLSTLAPEELPVFCLCLGDLTEHGLPVEYQQYKVELTDMLYNKYNIKTYNIVGNHDLYNNGWDTYKASCAPNSSFYKFETKNFSWYFLDSASCSLGYNQFESLSANMTADKKNKLVFTHVPLYADNTLYFVMQNSEERNSLISLFAKNKVKMVCDGHTHPEKHSDFTLFKEENIPGFYSWHGAGILKINEVQSTAVMETVYLD